MDGFLQGLEGYLSASPILAFIAVFLGGVLTSFTPCVYPMIPITIAYIGGRSGDSKLKGLSLSIFYVLGMAVTYAALGAFAALTGKFFGSTSTEGPAISFRLEASAHITGQPLVIASNTVNPNPS